MNRRFVAYLQLGVKTVDLGDELFQDDRVLGPQPLRQLVAYHHVLEKFQRSEIVGRARRRSDRLNDFVVHAVLETQQEPVHQPLPRLHPVAVVHVRFQVKEHVYDALSDEHVRLSDVLEYVADFRAQQFQFDDLPPGVSVRKKKKKKKTKAKSIRP